MTLRELALNMEHAGLYELSFNEYTQLPQNLRLTAQADAAKPCPTCESKDHGYVIAFTDLDHIGIEYWIKCANCEHVHRQG